VSIDGFSITNPGGSFAIYAKGRNNLNIQHNIVSGVGTTSLIGNTHAITVEAGSAAHSSGVTVSNNCINNVKGGENPMLTGAAAKANNGSV
jgi:hypothetical protein